MYIAHHVHTNHTPVLPVAIKAARPQEEQRFCPSMFCFTDEITVRRISAKAAVWLLTDESEDRSWLAMGEQPVCPHCGTILR
jgi:hypothetical protein